MTDWTASEAATAWGLEGSTYVKKLCNQGRIPGAHMEIENGNAVWRIPRQDRPAKLPSGMKAHKLKQTPR
jgi:hypothetical protein